MSDETGTAVMAPTAGTGNGSETNGSTDASANAGEQFYAATYKTREATEQGIRESQLAVNRAFAERDAERKKVNDLTDTIRKLAEGKTTEAKPPAPDRSSLIKDIDEKGAEAIVDIVERGLRETDEHYERRLNETTRKAEDRIARLEKRFLDSDPEYAANKETAQAIAAEMGLDPDNDRTLIMKFVRKLNSSASPGRPQLPGTTATPVSARAGISVQLDEMSRSFLESNPLIGKLTPEEARTLASVKADTADRRRQARVA